MNFTAAEDSHGHDVATVARRMDFHLERQGHPVTFSSRSGIMGGVLRRRDFQNDDGFLHFSNLQMAKCVNGVTRVVKGLAGLWFM